MSNQEEKRAASDWFQWCCWETSVYMQLSKQMLMESRAAGCFQSLLGLLSVMTQWPVEFGVLLQSDRYTITRICCYGFSWKTHAMFYSVVLEGCEPTDNWKCNCHWCNQNCRTTMQQHSRCNNLWRMRNSRLRGQYLKRLFESLHSRFDEE